MIFACISVRFKDGIPNVNFEEKPTYHDMDLQVVPPKRLPRPGDTVIIKTIGIPQVKLVVDRLKDGDVHVLGGPICGKARFYDPTEGATPWADKETVRGDT